ncbi:MAG: HAD-IA family hydrolase [Actinobacteria bacterium]|nr:HAD-IA family hydrolase [Actinomycetota bacterium]
MIRAVLFDYGGVILSSPFEAFARFEKERGLPDGFLRQVNATNHHDNAWARLERSELALAGFATEFARESAELGHEVDGAEVLALLAGEVRPAMVEALRRCHERLKTALLTNNFIAVSGQESFADPDSPHAAVLQHLDVIVESSQVGLRKPDPRFYELACERLQIEPSQAVFLDDLGVNLKPAREMGMTTIKVTDPADAITRLESVVGFPLR